MSDATSNKDDGRDAAGQQEDACEAPACGPGCGCEGPVISRNVKTTICLAVGLAATVLVARGILKRSASISDRSQQSFAIPSVTDEDTSKPMDTAARSATDEVAPEFWDVPLDSLASLNSVAADKDVVFVLLPGDAGKGVQETEALVETTAGKIMSRGKRVGIYRLEKDSVDYVQLTSRTAAPFVIAMGKGCGSSTVSGEITEKKLMQAYIMASKPVACGDSSGCGSSTSCD